MLKTSAYGDLEQDYGSHFLHADAGKSRNLTPFMFKFLQGTFHGRASLEPFEREFADKGGRRVTNAAMGITGR